MNVTDIRIRRTYEDGKLKALVSVTIDQDLAVHDIKVIEGSERLFVAHARPKSDNGVFRDVVHPITMEDVRLWKVLFWKNIINIFPSRKYIPKTQKKVTGKTWKR